jgi:AcrR family transcriptional regulator
MEIRQQLLQAAVKVYSTSGTRGATTRRIAEVAGVNEVTLFRHFGSKDALLRDAVVNIYDHSVPACLPEEPVDPRAELTEWCRRHHRFLTRIRWLLRTSMAEFAEHPEHVAHMCKLPIRIAEELRAYLVTLRSRGLAGGRWDARAASALLMGAVFADATQRDIMPERFPSSEARAIRQYVDLFLASIGATARRPRKRISERSRHASHARRHS